MSQRPTLTFRARGVARRILIRFPRIYARIARLRHRRDSSYIAGPEALRPDTEVLITALPRSGNSFAVNAFRLAQHRDVRIAHHEYPPSQIAEAARLGIPALLIVRDPDEVALSRVVSHPPLTLESALADYVQCHKAVLPYRPSFVLATFDEVTRDFGRVIRRLNQRFGTTFEEFEHSLENVEQAFDYIDDRYKAMGSAAERVFGRTVARPSQERSDAKVALRSQLETSELASLRLEARTLFQSLVGENRSDGPLRQ